MSRRALIVLAMIAVTAVVLPACSRKVARRPVDTRLLLSLEEARALEHSADLHLASGDAAAARRDVEAVLRVTFPRGAAEGEEARLDAWARLARLHLQPSAEAEALALADLEAGRKEATHDSFFRAHLETVAGEVLEARARRLGDGDAAGARQAREQALSAYARAIEIARRVQASLAEDAP